MKARTGTLWLAVAAAMLVPSKAKARGRTVAAAPRDDAPQRQSRRRADRGPQVLRPIASPCGRHVAEVIGGAVFVDGRRVRRAAEGNAFVLAPPTWRRDGGALAWIERSNGQARLVVVDELGEGSVPLSWILPAVAADDRVFWAGPRRTVVGPALLAPRAIASWAD
jgi:hypothetical protein